VSYPGYSIFYGGFGLWQGSLESGNHDIVIEYRNSGPTKNEPAYWETRALTIIQC